MTRSQPPGGGTLYDILEPSSYPIALDRVADLFRHGESHADRAVLGSPERLQHEGRGCHLATARRGQKIGSPPQSLHGNPPPGGKASGAQSLATARAPGRHHLAAAGGCHAGAESVSAFAHQFARLIGPLHGVCLRRPQVVADRTFSIVPTIMVACTSRRWPLAPKRSRFRGCRLAQSHAAYTGGRACPSMRGA